MFIGGMRVKWCACHLCNTSWLCSQMPPVSAVAQTVPGQGGRQRLEGICVWSASYLSVKNRPLVAVFLGISSDLHVLRKSVKNCHFSEKYNFLHNIISATEK